MQQRKLLVSVSSFDYFLGFDPFLIPSPHAVLGKGLSSKTETVDPLRFLFSPRAESKLAQEQGMEITSSAFLAAIFHLSEGKGSDKGAIPLRQTEVGEELETETLRESQGHHKHAGTKHSLSLSALDFPWVRLPVALPTGLL